MDLIPSNLNLAEVPELEADPYHPQNDHFYQQTEQVKRSIVAHQRNMKPLHVEITKMYFQGTKQAKIAEVLDITPTTVSNVIKRDDVQRLKGLLHYYQMSIDGPSVAHRKAILNRIIVDNEKKAPKVATAAIAELNKMDVQQHNIEADSGGPQINVTINQNVFPRTSLDG